VWMKSPNDRPPSSTAKSPCSTQQTACGVRATTVMAKMSYSLQAQWWTRSKS
jgi:hypothetical protein